MQCAAVISWVINCPKNIISCVLGAHGETAEALERIFAASIKIDQRQDPVRITIAGESIAVGNAAAAVRKIIAEGNPDSGGLDAEGSGHRGPASGFKGASSSLSQFSLASIIV